MHALRELSYRIGKMEEELRKLVLQAEQLEKSHTHDRYRRGVALLKNALTALYGASYCLRKFLKEQKF